MMTGWKNTPSTYGTVSRLFHWSTALIVLGLLGLGFYMHEVEAGQFKFQLYGLHKSFGILVLTLAALRILWNLGTSRPSALATHQKWEKFLSKAIHLFLYITLIGMPLSGWIMSSAGQFPMRVFGLFDLPALTGKNPALFDQMREIHETFAYGLIAALALHIAGALKHHLIDRDSTLTRMGGNMALVALGLALLAIPVFFAGGELFEEEEAPVNNTSAATAAPASHDLAPATGHNWQIIPASSHISFTFIQYGKRVQGAFTRFDGDIVFDPDNLAGSHAAITIDTANFSTGSGERDAQGTGAGWFDTATYPSATFETESFEHLGSNQYLAKGRLKIRDVEMPLTLPFSLNIEEGDDGLHTATMRAKTRLNRLDFGIGQGGDANLQAVENEVEIEIEVTATQR
ncbi:MAG: cytochrome b/b6 domain-containing protein [Alphaproteobacteria bacterium]|nr:cytochrome b/b6 domain-containing protein [Alphaproteobacteria bacterium]